MMFHSERLMVISIGGSVHFDGNDHLSIGSAGDFDFQNGDFTLDCRIWVKVQQPDNLGIAYWCSKGNGSLTIMSSADNQF